MNKHLQDSRVQFFHSESSFASSSKLSQSRVNDLVDELMAQTQTIFSNLRSVLYPREQLVKRQQLNHILHRGKILLKETLPTHIQMLEEENNVHEICKSKQQLKKLFSDYEMWKANELKYQQFYNLYGRNGQRKMMKKSLNNSLFIDVKPEIVEIIEQNPSPHTNLKGSIPQTKDNHHYHSNRQIQQLKQQVYRLKKRQKQYVSSYEKTIFELKMNYEERIQNIIDMFKKQHNISNNNKSSFVKDFELKQNEQLKKEIQISNKKQKQIQTLTKELQDREDESNMLRSEVEHHRRINMNTDNTIHNKSSYSPRSQQNHNNSHHSNSIVDKKLENLKYENNLLKLQLNKERQNIYNIKKKKQDDKEMQVIVLKKGLQAKNHELSSLKDKIDKMQIQNIKLTDQYNSSDQMLKRVKSQNNVINNIITTNANRQSMKDSKFKEREKERQKERNRRTAVVRKFEGDTIQGQPYYQLLSKEFRIRYRRSCLKDKELLYKESGIEVGVISNNVGDTEEIKINLHISNFSENQKINNLKLKVINSNDNFIHNERSLIQVLREGEQAKCNIVFEPKNYPLGASILLCEYEYYGKVQSCRLLLPTNIFKTVVIKRRDGQFRIPKNLIVFGEKKITKDLQSFFKDGIIEQNTIKCCIIHPQTETKLLLDIIKIQSKFEIKYQHRVGEQNITEYFIKNLEFLLSKQP